MLLAVTGLFVAAAVALSRAMGDAATGAVIGSVAMFFGFAGGLTVFNGHHPLRNLESPQLLAGAAALIAVAVICYAGVADRPEFFAAGVHAGLFAVIAALLGLTNLSTPDIAGIVVATAVVLAPALPLLSVRLGKLPVPALPAST